MTLLLLALAACTSDEKDAGETAGRTGDTLDDCPVDEALFTDVTAEIATVQTVVRVSWATTEAAEARVLYVEEADGEEGETLATPARTGASGEQLVLGLHPNRDVRVQVEATAGGARACSPVVDVRTGALPSDLPATVLTVNDTTRDVRGWHTVPVIRPAVRYATILDADGQFVWAWESPGAFRSTISRDGTAMLVNHPAPVWDGVGSIERIPLDGGPSTIVEVPGSHTDFVELPDGTIATLGWTRRGFLDDSRWLLGDTIIEVRPDGTQVELWNIFDHIEPQLQFVYAPSPVAGDDVGLEEWSHVNSISYDAAEDDYLVTGTFNHGVMRVDRATGALEWVLTDDRGSSDWVLEVDGRELEMPHSVQQLDADTLLVFNRGPIGSGENPTACAWVSEIDLDVDTRAATPTWHYSSDECVIVPFLGGAERVDGGNTVISWSAAGRLSQVDAEEDVVLQVDMGLGAAFGFSAWRASLYGPVDAGR